MRCRCLGLLALAWVTACEAAPAGQRGEPKAAASAPAAAGSEREIAAAASAEPSASPPPKPRAPSELPGDTIDYVYDAKDIGDPTRAYEGRAFVHDRVLAAREAAPLVVFLHGLNRELIPHRWMGGGNEGDVRRIVADLVDRGAIPPVILAGPGSIAPAAVSGGASFPVFDMDRFLALTEAALSGVARVDRKRIVVTGHSGAGCSAGGGLVAAVRAKTRPLAVVSIDTCMMPPLAEALADADPDTHVVVTWQTASWKRGFDQFRAVFKRELAAHPPSSGILRELDVLPTRPRAHDATVVQTFDKWLPRILAPQ